MKYCEEPCQSDICNCNRENYGETIEMPKTKVKNILIDPDGNTARVVSKEMHDRYLKLYTQSSQQRENGLMGEVRIYYSEFEVKK